MANSLPWIKASGAPIPNIGWWKLNEGIGTNAADSSGASNTGTLVNTPSWIVNGSGFALTFSSASLQCVSTTKVVNIPNVTISAWLKLSSYPASKRNIVGFCDGLNSATADKIMFVDTDGKLYFYAYCSGTYTTSAPAAQIGTGAWHHVAATCDSSNLYTYVDGSQVGTIGVGGGSYTGYSLANIFIAAACGSSQWGYLDGSVDDVRVWDSALSPFQINSLFSGGPS